MYDLCHAHPAGHRLSCQGFLNRNETLYGTGQMKRMLFAATKLALLLAFVLMSSLLSAQEAPSECVVMGALAYDNWTKPGAGGSGSPSGVQSADYIRCKI